MEGRPDRASVQIIQCSAFIGNKTSVGIALPVAVGVEGFEITFLNTQSRGWIKQYINNPRKRKFVQTQLNAAPAAVAESWAAGAEKKAYVCKLHIGELSELVIVKIMQESDNSEGLRAAFQDLEKAARYAERFNDSRLRVSTPVLAKLHNAHRWSGRTVLIEPHLNGKFGKFCWADYNNSPYHEMPHAFACFTYFASGRSEIAWDLQGAQNGETYLLTDPMWYTREVHGEDDIEECMALHRHTHCCKTGWHTELEHGKQYRLKMGGKDIEDTTYGEGEEVYLAIKNDKEDWRSPESRWVCVRTGEYSQRWQAESSVRGTWRFFQIIGGLKLYLTIRDTDERGGEPSSCWVCARVEDAADMPEWIVSSRNDGAKRLAMPVGSKLMYLTFWDDESDRRGDRSNWACGLVNTAAWSGWIVEACPL